MPTRIVFSKHEHEHVLVVAEELDDVVNALRKGGGWAELHRVRSAAPRVWINASRVRYVEDELADYRPGTDST